MEQKCRGVVHIVKSGDTLYRLSRVYQVPLAMILRANPYVDVYNLRIGQELCIPVRKHRPYEEKEHKEAEEYLKEENTDEKQQDESILQTPSEFDKEV